jgi:hypothetical protein
MGTDGGQRVSDSSFSHLQFGQGGCFDRHLWGHTGMFVSKKCIVVEFGDCDPAGIVYNPQYLRWFDACTSALFANAGVPYKDIFKAHGGIGIPIVSVVRRVLTSL